MRLFIILLIASFSFVIWAQKERVIYKYKKYEKFDFSAIGVEGNTGNPGDLSVIPQIGRKRKSRLPERKNFKDKMRENIEAIR